jgi:hypothetical protein
MNWWSGKKAAKADDAQQWPQWCGTPSGSDQHDLAGLHVGSEHGTTVPALRAWVLMADKLGVAYDCGYSTLTLPPAAGGAKPAAAPVWRHWLCADIPAMSN